MKDLPKRIITGVVLGIVVLLMLIIRGYILKIGLLIITSISLYEWHANVLNKNMRLLLFDVIFSAFLFLLTNDTIEELIPAMIVFFVFMMISTLFFKLPADIMIKRVFSLVYIIIPLRILLLLGQSQYWAWTVFALSFASDTFAYFVGMAWGVHPLAPGISPRKSVEGSLGGIVGASIIAIIIGVWWINIPIGLSLGLGICASVAAQLGDLVESHIKRSIGIKDFGYILPGHGGMLDRFDSILMVAPLVFALVTFYIR